MVSGISYPQFYYCGKNCLVYNETMNKSFLMWLTGAVVASLVAGYLVGNSLGYKKAEADIKKLNEAAAQKATDDLAKAANPFQAVNPLEGIEANPFEKAKKVLNPF